MGCAEGKLVGLMKRRGHVEQLIGVDINPQLLRGQQNMIQPLTTDFLLPRERPLHITLMQGNQHKNHYQISKIFHMHVQDLSLIQIKGLLIVIY